MNSVATIGLTALFAALPLVAVAEYPDKPVEFVVPWPPGDLEDVVTRIIADHFQEKYGVAAAVVNKPGGGGGPFPGAVSVANAPADGYTVGSFIQSVPVVGPTLGIPDLTAETFDPLGIFLTYPFVIVAKGEAPYDDMAGLAAYAKDNDVVLGHFGAPLTPTKVTFALASELGFSFASEAAFDELNCNTLTSGDVDVMSTTLQQVLPCLDTIKVLASVGEERLNKTPNAPTVIELAPDLDISMWNGLFVVRDTPADVRAKIIDAAQEAMALDRIKTLAEETGARLYWQDAETATARIERNKATLARINEMIQ